jgi:hypothetical protein
MVLSRAKEEGAGAKEEGAGAKEEGAGAKERRTKGEVNTGTPPTPKPLLIVGWFLRQVKQNEQFDQQGMCTYR